MSVMNESSLRMTGKGSPPSAAQVAAWLGRKAYLFWRRIADRIARSYPGVFEPEWLYGGAKHGWSLRYKKSKSFCTLIPEKGRCRLLIVFGAEERAKAEKIRPLLSPATRDAYDAATTYHDGKWLLCDINSDSVFDDAVQLLAVKRRPRGS